MLHNSHKKQKFMLYCGENSLEILNKIQNILTESSKYFILKSIKYLRKDCSKEFIATLSDKTTISIEYLGEYLSREYYILVKEENSCIDITNLLYGKKTVSL